MLESLEPGAGPRCRRSMLGRRSIIWVSTAVVLGSSVVLRTLHGAVQVPTVQTGQTATVARNSAAGARPVKSVEPSRRRAMGALPDTVLVRVDHRRDVVLSFAVRRWREQHSATHSITPAAL